jgi:cysteinyl-tRNA synthetase
MTRHYLAAMILVMLPIFLCFCGDDDDDDSAGEEEATESDPPYPAPENGITHAYQLQGYTAAALEKLIDSKYAMIIMDGSNELGEDFSATDLAALHSFPERKLLAYLSIGEAEDYRDYWENLDKEIVIAENPEWEGNYLVKYWEPAWQEMMAERAAELISQGFDGVYLDKIDAFNDFVYVYPEQTGYSEDDLPDLQQKMIAFVQVIAAAVHAEREEAMVFPQNGIELLEDESYREIIDGLGKEDTFFVDDDRSGDLAWELNLLKLLLDAGKPVLNIDYCSEKNRSEYFSRALAAGLNPYWNPDRDLKNIVAYEELWKY